MPKQDLVLIAIGDEGLRRSFEQALGAASYATAIATQSEELERLLQVSTPSLVIISQEFQGADGLELAKNLLDRFPTLPILLFIERDSATILRQAIHSGVSDIFSAPLTIDKIVQTVEHSLKRADRLGDWTRKEVKRTTASLQQRVDVLQKFDTILNRVEDGVIILDEAMKILLINPAARRVFGIWDDEILMGLKVTEVITHPDLENLLSGGTATGMPHHEITFEDGRVLSAQFSQIPNVGGAITLQDITYLKQIDRLKNEFVNTVSHDLRSPLTAILGYVDLLERVGPVNPQQKEFIKRVQISVSSITSLVNDLLELGRIEAGLDLQKELVPIEGLIRYTLENFSGLIDEKKISIKMKLPDDLVTLRGNPIRIRQLLDNLIGNAIKYTPVDGRVWVEVEKQDHQVILRVEDTGVGIPPAEQPHIFEKFYRGSNVPKGVGGSGLGLAIVKSIVESHRGRIWVESATGKGSSFTIVFPEGAE